MPILIFETRLIRAILITNDADFSHILYTPQNTESRNYKFGLGFNQTTKNPTGQSQWGKQV